LGTLETTETSLAEIAKQVELLTGKILIFGKNFVSQSYYISLLT